MRTSIRRMKGPVIALCVLIAGWSASVADAKPKYDKTPAGISDASRDASTYDDFMRLLWVRPGTQVTYLGRHDAMVTNLRAFFTASTFVEPSVTVEQFATLIGNYYPSGQDLVLVRCQPSPEQQQAISPILATWPNVFAAIASDFAGHGYSCPPTPSDGNKVMFCAAQAYQDAQDSVFVTGLAAAFVSATLIFQDSVASPGAIALKNNYGIYPAFTGLGYAASASGLVPTMSTAQVLQESIVPEYLLKNALLVDAGCRCIQVPEYGNAQNSDVRRTKRVDPDYVWKKGKLDDGSCRRISKLPQ